MEEHRGIIETDRKQKKKHRERNCPENTENFCQVKDRKKKYEKACR